VVFKQEEEESVCEGEVRFDCLEGWNIAIDLHLT